MISLAVARLIGCVLIYYHPHHWQSRFQAGDLVLPVWLLYNVA
jgi:hypothetical protein